MRRNSLTLVARLRLQVERLKDENRRLRLRAMSRRNGPATSRQAAARVIDLSGRVMWGGVAAAG